MLVKGVKPVIKKKPKPKKQKVVESAEPKEEIEAKEESKEEDEKEEQEKQPESEEQEEPETEEKKEDVEEATEKEEQPEETPEPTEGIDLERVEGIVKFFNSNKGFGFITGDDGNEYYVHENELVEGVAIEAEDRVSFKVVQGDKGLKAKEVVKIND